MLRIWRIVRLPLFVCVFSVALFSALLVANPNWIRVQDIVLELADESDEMLLFHRIKTTLDPQFEKLKGKLLWQVPLKSILKIAETDRRVKHVSVFRETPARVKLIIEPYTPILAYLGVDGRIYPVATDATLLPSLPLGDAPDLPLLRGEDLKDEPRLRELALELYNLVPETGDLTRKDISEIAYSKKDGFRFFVGKVEVKMGDTDFGPKVSRVSRVLNYLDSQNIKGRVIDARFSKKVVVRVRNSP
jgi:cell division septal protein FtsQ